MRRLLRTIKYHLLAPLFKSGECVAVFVPVDAKGDSDSVRLFYSYLTAAHRKLVHIVLLDRTAQHFRNVLADNDIDWEVTRLVLFAHPSPHLNGFLANHETPGKSSYLLLRFWRKDTRQYDLIVAHVCRGALILARDRWRDCFPQWVSFDREILTFTGTARAEGIWRSVFDGVLRESSARRTAQAAVAGLKAVYLQHLRDVHENYDAAAGDAVAVMYLTRCIDSLRCSEDPR